MKSISINLHHMHGCSSMSSKILFSRSAINIIAYSGTNLVLNAVTLNFFNVFSLNRKMLFSETISASSNNVSFVTSFSALASKNFLTEARPYVLNIYIKLNLCK